MRAPAPAALRTRSHHSVRAHFDGPLLSPPHLPVPVCCAARRVVRLRYCKYKNKVNGEEPCSRFVHPRSFSHGMATCDAHRSASVAAKGLLLMLKPDAKKKRKLGEGEEEEGADTLANRM